MLSLWRNVPKYLLPNAIKISTVQLKTVSISSASIADQVQHDLISQLKDQSNNWHVKPSGIEKAVQNDPSLLKYSPSQWDSLFNCLLNVGFAGNNILTMIQTYPNLLTTDCNNIIEVWNALTLFRLSADKLVQAVAMKPHILCNPTQNIEAKAHAILNFVGFKNNSLLVINNCKNLFALPLEELQKVIEYVEGEMKVKRKHEICRSTVVECPLNKLKMRHTFLVLCGLYVPQKHDVPVTVPHSNPLLYLIVDTSDETFAEQAAKVTPEEFYVYQDLWEKERYEEIYDYSDDE